MNAKYLLTTFFLFIFIFGFAQTATITGVILDENNKPINSININADNIGTQTNENGFYSLKIPANQEITVTFLQTVIQCLGLDFYFIYS